MLNYKPKVSRQESLREAWRSYARSVDLDVPRTKASAIELVKGFLATKNIEFYYDRLGLRFGNTIIGCFRSKEEPSVSALEQNASDLASRAFHSMLYNRWADACV